MISTERSRTIGGVAHTVVMSIIASNHVMIAAALTINNGKNYFIVCCTTVNDGKLDKASGIWSWPKTDVSSRFLPML